MNSFSAITRKMLSCSDWSALCNQELHHHNGILSQLLLKIRIHSFTIRFLVSVWGAIFVVIMSARSLGSSSGAVQQTCCALSRSAISVAPRLLHGGTLGSLGAYGGENDDFMRLWWKVWLVIFTFL
jgi:hypothetical protein